MCGAFDMFLKFRKKKGKRKEVSHHIYLLYQSLAYSASGETRCCIIVWHLKTCKKKLNEQFPGARDGRHRIKIINEIV